MNKVVQEAYRRLQEGQEALEQGYLQAREEYHSLQPRDTGTSGHSIGTFDPGRDVEGDIFRLGMHLEDVKERMEPVPETSGSTDHQSDEGTLPNSWLMRGPAPQPRRPRPLVEPPKPTSPSPADSQHHPKRRLLVPSATSRLGKVDVEVSSVSGESEGEDIIPRTLTHKKIQLEESFDKLLDQCENFRDLPLSLELDKVGQRRVLESPPTPPNAQRLGKEGRMEGRWTGASCSDLEAESRKTPEPRQPMKMAAMFCGVYKDSRQPEVGGEELVARGRSFTSHAMSPDSEGVVLMERRNLSPAKSEASVDRAASPELMPCKTLLRAVSGPLEERIVSPETDSGFVGSECSRITPAVHTPEQWPLKRSESHKEPSLKPVAQGSVGAEAALGSQQGGGRGVSDHRMERGRDRGPQGSTVQPTLSHTSSPHHWPDSVLSELEQDTFVSHTEFEVDGVYSRPRYQRSSLTSSPLTFHPKVPYSTSPLNVRSARDQLIQSLQTEVAQLRHRLEQALHKPRGQADGNPPPAVGSTSKHLAHQHLPRRKLPREEEEEEEAGESYSGPRSSAGHDHSKPFPHYGSELEISTESEASSSDPHPSASKHASVIQNPKRPTPCRLQRSRPVRGPYTGTDYSLLAPWYREHGLGWEPCPSCGASPAQRADTWTKTTGFLTSSPRRNPCPACKRRVTHDKRGFEGKPHPVAEEKRPAERRQSVEGRGVGMKERPVAMGYAPTLGYIPPVSPVHYCSPGWAYLSPTQSHVYYPLGHRAAEWSSPWRRRRLGSRGGKPSRGSGVPWGNGETTVLELGSSLQQAIEAAESMKWTTLKMVKSLSSDLHKARAT
ncbi:microtubule organization protein AKNA-like [Rhinoraja longicauda]